MRAGVATPMIVDLSAVQIAEALARDWPDLVRLSGGLLAPDVAKRFGCSERMAFYAVGMARELVA